MYYDAHDNFNSVYKPHYFQEKLAPGFNMNVMGTTNNNAIEKLLYALLWLFYMFANW